MSDQKLVIQFTPPNEAVRKLVPRTFANLQKSGYFPAERYLEALSNGDYETDLTPQEYAKFAAMVGCVPRYTGGGQS